MFMLFVKWAYIQRTQLNIIWASTGATAHKLQVKHTWALQCTFDVIASRSKVTGRSGLCRRNADWMVGQTIKKETIQVTKWKFQLNKSSIRKQQYCDCICFILNIESIRFSEATVVTNRISGRAVHKRTPAPGKFYILRTKERTIWQLFVVRVLKGIPHSCFASRCGNNTCLFTPSSTTSL